MTPSRVIIRYSWPGRVRLATLAATLLAFFPLVIFVLPVRNVLFYCFTPPAWRQVPTIDLLRIHFLRKFQTAAKLPSVSCSHDNNVVNITRDQINMSSILAYPHLRSKAVIKTVLEKHHGRYLPSLNTTQKLNYLYLYSAMSELLNSAGVKHFLVSGSLLGASRHGGFIPWDDDLDVSVSYQTWDLVQLSLACVKGFALVEISPFHWKFQFDDGSYPFVDIFLYDSEENYVWALTPYIRITYIYPIDRVFPLTWTQFEGLTVPVPKDWLGIAKRIYDYNTCSAYRRHLDSGNSSKLPSVMVPPSGFTITSLPCQDLAYMYNFRHLTEI